MYTQSMCERSQNVRLALATFIKKSNGKTLGAFHLTSGKFHGVARILARSCTWHYAQRRVKYIFLPWHCNKQQDVM